MKTSIGSGIGRRHCAVWTRETYGFLQKMEISNRVREVTVFAESSSMLRRINLDFHRWIEIRENDRRFIADGTAGQIFPEHHLGFYGFADEIPKGMNGIYNSKSRCYVPKKESSLISSYFR